MILDNLCNLHNTKVIHAMFEDHLPKKNWTSRLDMNPGVDMLSRLSSIPPAYSHASATTTTIKKPFAFHYITAVISGTHPENMCISLIFWKFCRSNFLLCREPRQFVSFKLQLFSNTCQNIFFVYLTDHRSFCFHLGR